MPTVMEKIYQAALAAVHGLPSANAVFDRERVAVFAREEMPCVRILDGDDVYVENIGGMVDLRELTLHVEFFLHGADQVALVDGMRNDAVARILGAADVCRLAGNVIVGDRPRPDRQESDGLQVRVEQQLRISYPCERNNLSASA